MTTMSAIRAVTTNSSLLHDFRDSPPHIRYMGIAVLQIRRFAAGTLCAATLVLSSVAQAQVADDPQLDGLSTRGRGFRLNLEETPVLVIELPWPRSQKVTAESPQETETGNVPRVDLVGFVALHTTYPLFGLDEHERPRLTWTMPEIRRTSWAGRLLCLADRHGDSPQCWENDVTRIFQAEAYRMGISPPGTWFD
jgi:hypothetical protein